MGELVTKKRLSEIFGISQPTLTELQKLGMPIEERGERGQRHTYDTSAVYRWLLAREAAKHHNGDGRPLDLDQERAALARVDRELKELALRQRQGELVERRKMQGELFAAARIGRDALLSTADRLAAVVAGEHDERKVYSLLQEETRRIATELATALRRIAGPPDLDDEVLRAELEAIMEAAREAWREGWSTEDLAKH
jgi:phage terminase Nu1 subunit (DNA packaging protein)